MVNSELRKTLNQDVHRLITGRMNADEFNEAFYFRYASTEDQGIREIANLYSSLMSVDLNAEDRNRQRNGNPAQRGLVARSILFLDSDLEYEWPGDSISPGQRTIVGLTIFLMLPVLMAVALFWLPVPIAVSEKFTTPLALAGVAGMFGALCLICFQPKRQKNRLDGLSRRGDSDLWPFRRAADLNRAACKCNLAAQFAGQKI